eukprot:CAMPEP_0197695766 /NCGR_PEP_ID=MMETSP1338-20131121/115634_1 /TAXON_ID=43686 ORGANISM="Pelagodinium beii, Strain RCC1491" /NCGR_SAMPLE_ID=MMETSP1338 /ASSEMBLY_ACC=CAM_ASM_000754 /LENGTH=48 /DNA_ID= /DNA_START= /DNA_END= /DNA_ORIENTATION=
MVNGDDLSSRRHQDLASARSVGDDRCGVSATLQGDLGTRQAKVGDAKR